MQPRLPATSDARPWICSRVAGMCRRIVGPSPVKSMTSSSPCVAMAMRRLRRKDRTIFFMSSAAAVAEAASGVSPSPYTSAPPSARGTIQMRSSEMLAGISTPAPWRPIESWGRRSFRRSASFGRGALTVARCRSCAAVVA